MTTIARRASALLPGGISIGGKATYYTVPLGGVPLSMLGTDKAVVSGTQYLSEIFIPRRVIITKIGFLTGSVIAGSVIGVLWNLKGSSSVSFSATAGIPVTAGVNSVFEFGLNASGLAQGPGRFWLGLQFNNTSMRFRTIAANTYTDVWTNSFLVGAFGTLTQPSVGGMPTGFVADVGPIAYVIEE